MATMNKLGETVRESWDTLAEGWQDLWNKARAAITRFTPASENDQAIGNRWGLLSAELHESSDGITVEIEAPGLGKDDFTIFVSGQTLVVRGTRQASSERKEGHYHITERAYGRFERTFALPIEVDEGRTSASYRRGVLRIELPRSEKAQPRIVSVT